MKKKKKYLLVGVLLGIAAAGIIIFAIQFRLRGSIKVVPGVDIAGIEAVFYRQDDVQWSADFLGDTQYTMGSSGCLVTCIAASMEMSSSGVALMADGWIDDLGWRKTPGELNQYLSQNSVYDSQGNLQWEQLRKLDYIQVDVYDTISTELIQECLMEGRYPIVRVRMNGFGNFHYVLIIESSNGMFYCIDPLNPDNVPVPLAKYNNRVYAVRCVYPKYQKTEPETDQTAINEQEDDWQVKLDLDIMPDKPLYIPQTLIQDIEAIILNGEEHEGQYWKDANLGNYNPDGKLLEIIHDEIGMFEDIDEFLSRANFYKVDFDNDGYEDIVVHLRGGNGRMAMYAWHFLCNDGKGGYRKTEVWSSCMSYGRFIEFERLNYLIEIQDDIITGAARIFTGIGINYYAEGRLMEHVFLSFGATDKAEVICDQEGNPLTVTECPVSGRDPVQYSIYTKHVNTLFTDGY